MSYSILVNETPPIYELDDTRSTLANGRGSPYRNRNCQQKSLVDLFALITRTIFFRRLRSLKIYMAFTAVLLLLFFILKPDNPNKYEADAVYPKELQSLLPRGKTNGPGVMQSDATIRDSVKIFENIEDPQFGNSKLIAQQKKSDNVKIEMLRRQGVSTPTSHVAKNFSFTLSESDFTSISLNVMQARIRQAAKHTWDNYKRYAWGYDMLKPRAKEPDHWFDLGLTIVDGADTLILMGLTNEVRVAVDWMETELKFNSRNENSNCFELTIRILGGILSAYHFTKSEKLKQQAIKFGDILLHCYDTDSKVIPFSDIDLGTKKAHPPSWNGYSSLSEVTSLQLEFRYLSQISGDPRYERTTFDTSIYIHNLTQLRTYKLLPMFINPADGSLYDTKITLGARSDSYYEYLFKQYLQTGIEWLETDYLDSIDHINKFLIRHTNGPQNYAYIAEMQIFKTVNDTDDLRYIDRMDHLVCFLPGTLVLGYYHFSPLASEYRLKYNLETKPEKLNSRYDNHLDMAKVIARTCYAMYSTMGTGLSPEIANFVHSENNSDTSKPELVVQSDSAHNILRPEFVESLFYLYHVTGLPKYRTQAAEIFEAFEKYSRISSGYSAISDVRIKPSESFDINEGLHKHAPDRMESFWLSETLKYLYLIFCDDKHVVGTILNNYVFNTEAHLFPIS